MNDALAVILVSSGSRENPRLLFRYPYESCNAEMCYLDTDDDKLLYDISNGVRKEISNELEAESKISSNLMNKFADKDLSNLLGVKTSSRDEPIQLKVNDLMFVGYPVQIHGDDLFNVVFALQAKGTDEEEVRCYQNIAKKLALALRHEEQVCSYLSKENREIIRLQDENASSPESEIESPYSIVLKVPSITLCHQLKKVYDGLRKTGIVDIRINEWLHVSACLPHKVHCMHLPKFLHQNISVTSVKRAISALRPYHAILLLVGYEDVLSHLPPDSSPSFHRILNNITPLKSIQKASNEVDLPLRHVFHVMSHLVYWGKAIIIYPLCESNTYVLAPNTNIYVNSKLVENFVKEFPGMSLPVVLNDFSLPTSLGEKSNVLDKPKQQIQQVQIAIWLLRHRILIQLHTYVFLIPPDPVESYVHDPRSRYRSSLSPLCEDPNQYFKARVSTASIESSSSDELPNFPSYLTTDQKNKIMKVDAASVPEDLKLFCKLCPYFNGHYSLEEIMYYKNVPRSTLHQLVDKFQQVLITCQHENQDISILSD